MSCTHTRWVYPEPYLDDYGFGEQWVYPNPQEVSTTKDLDTGRYQCTQCGEIMYYTGRWRDIYEGKIKPDPDERKWMNRKP